MELELEVRMLSERRAVLVLAGRLDAIHAPAVRARIQALVGEGRVELVCDLREVAFIDASGLAALVSGLKAAREQGGFLKLAGLREPVARTFRVTLLDHVFELNPTVEAALA